MDIMEQKDLLWCECTQDMSGYVLPEITSPLLDEHIQFEFSSASYGNDINRTNMEVPTSEDLILEDSLDAVLGESSNMFDNTNYSLLDKKIGTWLPKISSEEIDEFAETIKTENGYIDPSIHINTDYPPLSLEQPKLDRKLLATAIKKSVPKIGTWSPKILGEGIDKFAETVITENGYFNPSIHINTDYPLISSVIPKLERKLPATSIKKPSPLSSIFECEEPFIKEDMESLSSCCTENKQAFELRDDMEVAEEVVITTEYPEELEPKESPFLFNSASMQCLDELKVGYSNTQVLKDIHSTPEDTSCMDTWNITFDVDEDFLCTLDPVTPAPVPQSKVAPKLHLNISAAMATSNQLLMGNLADTPEVLKPVLDPGLGFDLVNYLVANNCDSSNSSSRTSTTSTSTKKSEQRKGKSHLTLAELKKSQDQSCEVQSEPLSGQPSRSSKRPSRASATKSKKKSHKGLLRHAHGYSSDESDSVALSKHRKTTTSCIKKRSNANVCESALKYREMRDRNNLSSKKSRQKRKIKQELKRLELEELEEKNKRLKKCSEQLQSTLNRIHTAWKDYLTKKVNKRREHL